MKNAFAPLAAILLVKSIDVREAYEESKRYVRFLDQGQNGESYASRAQRVDNAEFAFEGNADKWNTTSAAP